MFDYFSSTSAKLTVGARALAKHCHRDDSLQWWGKCSGSKPSSVLANVPRFSVNRAAQLIMLNLAAILFLLDDADKNAHAFEVVSRIMREATWINIHSLPVCDLHWPSFVDKCISWAQSHGWPVCVCVCGYFAIYIHLHSTMWKWWRWEQWKVNRVTSHLYKIDH